MTLLTRLVEDGQDPNATSGQFRALWVAASHGRRKCLKLLLDANADMEKADAEQRSPLLIATDLR